MSDYPRFRQRTQDRRYSGAVKVYSDYGTSPSAWAVPGSSGTYRYMEDWVTPRFSERSAQGQVLMNPMDSVTATMTGAAGQYGMTYYTGNPAYWRKYDGDQSRFCTGWGNASVGDYWKTADSLLQPADINNTAIEACTRARSQIGRSNTDMWENLAEAHKTMELLRHPIASWFKFEKKARVVTAGLTAAQAWLSYRYGIAPLVKSVDEVLKNMRVGLHPERGTTRASAVYSVPTVASTFVTPTTYWNVCSFTVARQQTHSYLVRAMSLDELINETQYTYGLSTKSLLTLPWELLPYSFVVDWFANVGDFIGAIGQAFQPRSLGQCHSWTNTYSEYRTCIGTTVNPGQTYTVASAFGGWTRVDIIRKGRAPGLLGPGLVFKQNFRLDSATRIGDSLALIGQQLLRRFR